MAHFQYRFSYLIVSLPLLIFIALGWLIGEGRLYLSSYSSRNLYDADALWLGLGSEVKQEFVATYSGLNQVDVFVKWQAGSPDKSVITFYLRRSCQVDNNLNAQEVTQSAGQIDGLTFYSFKFPPLEDSSDQKYCFILKSSPPVDYKNLVGVLASTADVYPQGRAFYRVPPPKMDSHNTLTPTSANKLNPDYQLFLPLVMATAPTYENTDVAFQLHYLGWHLETVGLFFMRLTEYKSYFWGSPWFYIVLLIAYFSGVTLLIGLTLPKR